MLLAGSSLGISILSAVFYQPFRYFSVSKAFFLPILCRHLPCFPRNFDFSSGIFYILRMPPVVFLSAILAFFSSRSIFSACFVQAPAVFFSVILIFHLESFVFCGYCLPFFSSHSRIFCASPEFFSKEKPVFFGFRFPFSGIFPSPFESFSSFFPCSVGNFSLHIHNFSTFLRTFRREFISHSGIFRFPNHFFCQSCAGSCRVFPPSSRFFSGIFCVLRMLLAVFFISHSGIFRFPEHFFLPVLCRRPPCFFSVIPIFI